MNREETLQNTKQSIPLSYMHLNLHFFDEGEKTEQPTAKKKNKARSEGQVAKSQEVGTAFLFVSVFFALSKFAPGMLDKMQGVYRYNFGLISNIDNVFTVNFISRLVSGMFLRALTIALPLMTVALVVGVITNLVQVGWHPTFKPIRPKFSKLNPIKGLKRLFSLQSVINLFKSIAKLVVIVITIYYIVREEIHKIPGLMSLALLEAVVYVGRLVIRMGINVGLLFMFIAALDYAYTRYKHNKQMKMSKHEVKEEMKQAEGNPQIKGKIRQKMREASFRRMMQSIPNADVIITNPTHYAVAIHYDKAKGEAPVVVAKGVDFLAKRIKEMAKENGVEIVENVQLARTLYATVDVGRPIPPELYQAVAEVLAFVYKLKNVSA